MPSRARSRRRRCRARGGSATAPSIRRSVTTARSGLRARGGRPAVDEIVDRLYALPLEEFTRERDAAAREVRKAGDRAAAAIIAKLPKPTPAAWAANQVAREHPDVLSALL